MYVPNGSYRLRIVQNCHDTYTARYFGSTKTLDLGQRSFSGLICEDLSKTMFGHVIHVVERRCLDRYTFDLPPWVIGSRNCGTLESMLGSIGELVMEGPATTGFKIYNSHKKAG